MPELTGWLCNKGHFTPNGTPLTATMRRNGSRCLTCHRNSDRQRQERYRATAKGLQRDIRAKAKNRGAS